MVLYFVLSRWLVDEDVSVGGGGGEGARLTGPRSRCRRGSRQCARSRRRSASVPPETSPLGSVPRRADRAAKAANTMDEATALRRVADGSACLSEPPAVALGGRGPTTATRGGDVAGRPPLVAHFFML
jgi:hypothetical protein